MGHAVTVAGRDAPLDALGVDLHAQDGSFVHGGGERLGSTHAAHPAGQHPVPAQGRPEVLAGERAERLIGALQDALGADVDPRSRGHLPEHDEAAPFQLPEVLPGRPVADQVGVRDEHPRRLPVGAEHPHRLSGLNEQRLVVGQVAKGAHDGVEGVPGARRPAGAAVHHQGVGSFGDLGIEVVHEHAQGGLLGPAAARDAASRGGPHGARPLRAGHESPPALRVMSAMAPEATRSESASRSAVSDRSPASVATRVRTSA